MKKIAIHIAILAGFLLSFQSADQIPYAESRKLTWDDFQGKADAASPFKARTESNLSIDVSTKDGVVTITMQTCFDKRKSWVKEKRDILLSHEQTHFDIAELWSRKFKQRLKGKTYSAKTFQKELSVLHSDIQKEGKAMQAQYDKETEHSINAKAQATWSKKISTDLKSLSQFTPPAVTCKLTK